MVYLAKHKKHVSLRVLAESEKISISFLEQIFSNLKKANLVQSIRGAYGGYVLCQQAKRISILDIIQAVDPLPIATKCKNSGKSCGLGPEKCAMHHFFEHLDQLTFSYLQNTMLSDILAVNHGEPNLKEVVVRDDLP
ncbi:MAG: HTH-type transcriptional regulator IscR [Holosporales bacterium]